ncbi:MAG: potassium channel family protein [Actinomycetes bacterium]
MQNFSKLFVKIANSPRYLVLSSSLLILVASTFYKFFEKRSLLDSIWWSLITASTVGYGDTVPHSLGGRTTAVVLVLVMILFLVPMITASFASKLIVDRNAFTHEEQEEMKQMLHQLLEIEKKKNKSQE